MSILSADIAKAINTRWNISSLDNNFTALWKSGVTASQWIALHDTPPASPGQPFPYVVYELGVGATTDRMSGDTNSNREIRDIPLDFRVHARAIDGDSRTAKEIAADLAEKIVEVFGGHPTVAPPDITLDNGNFLISQYQNDWGIKTGEDEYQWNVSYLIRVDVPVMHGV